MGLIMTNSEFKVKLKDFKNKIHEEGLRRTYGGLNDLFNLYWL